MIQTKTFAVVFLTAIAAMGATVTAGIFLQHANAYVQQNQGPCTDPTCQTSTSPGTSSTGLNCFSLGTSQANCAGSSNPTGNNNHNGAAASVGSGPNAEGGSSPVSQANACSMTTHVDHVASQQSNPFLNPNNPDKTC